jgi:hypothetical protein
MPRTNIQASVLAVDLYSMARALDGKVCGGQILCPGPGHSPKDHSLSVKFDPTAPDGFLVHSFTGDDPFRCKDFVRAKLGVEPFGPKASANSSLPAVEKIAPVEPKIVAVYDYTDENGELLYQVVRLEPKEFRQRRPDANGGWVYKLGNVRRVLYRLPKLLEAISNDRTVFIAEGEKDCDALLKLGVTATCNPMGAEKWSDAYSETLRGADVVIIPDRDKPGEKHLYLVASSLNGIASRVRVLRLLIGKDCHDWIAAGGTAQQLWQLVDAAPDWNGASNASILADNWPNWNEALNWPEPVPLREDLSPVPTLDTALLPAVIAPWVADISERMQCPPDFVGIPAIVALGSVLGRKIGIRPLRRDNWLEVPNLWGCVVGRPGFLKSPAVHEVLKPLHRLEMQANESHAEALKAHQKRHHDWKLKRDVADQALRQALKNGKPPTFKFDDAEPVVPAEKRYFTTDTTYERLGEILVDNPHGILAHRDELVSLLKTLDREEYAAARGFFLSAWSGTQPYKFDRIARGATHIPAACISLLGTTQPGRLGEYIRRAVRGGAGDDGLVQRFSLLVWPDHSGEWKNIDRYSDSEARRAVWDIFVSFDSTSPERFGAEKDEFEPVPFVRLDDATLGLFLEWRSDLERRLRSGDMHPAFESHLSKYRGLVPKLALINHLADGGVGYVTEPAMVRALGLADYLEKHAIRAYGAGAAAEVAAAKSILMHIRSGDLEDRFTARDVHQHGWSNLADRDNVQAGLRLLCELDWLAERQRDRQAGGRPTLEYLMNPKATA